MRLAPGTVFVVALAVVVSLAACDRRRVPDDEEEDETPIEGDDDDSAPVQGDDDDSADDFEWEGDPVLLATYDFTLVMTKNAFSEEFAAVHGQMDVSVTETQFLAELDADDGRSWAWFGSLTNTTSFEVWGDFDPPGSDSVRVRVAGNFLANAGEVDGSNSCLTGIGEDDDPNFGTEEGRFVGFTWYACRQDATPAAVDRSGAHAPTVSTVHWDNCGGEWTSWPAETWSFDGRSLVVTTQSGRTGWGVVSDDGRLFRYTILQSESPGRSVKVLGDFESTTVSQANGHGYCGEGSMSPDTRINLDGY